MENTIELDTPVSGWRYTMSGWADWTVKTLMVIGLITLVGFVRVNIFGADLSIQFPEYVPQSLRPVLENERNIQAEMAREFVKVPPQKKGQR